MSLGAKEGRAKACGKLIIAGEHAVVHGSSALAVPISRGIELECMERPGPLGLSVAPWDLEVVAGDGSLAAVALASLAQSLGVPCEGLFLGGESQLPPRSGLGSSAALAAAAARALVSRLGIEADEAALFEAVQAFERVFHGNPSGLDATVALSGRPVVFRRGQAPRWVLGPLPGFLVVSSGRPGDTRETVAAFAARLAAQPKEGSARLKRIDELVERAVDAVGRGDEAGLGEALSENQEHLAWFGVSNFALDEICSVARQAGALGAKLTGGGGGGCAVVLPGPNEQQVKKALEKAGYEVIADV